MQYLGLFVVILISMIFLDKIWLGNIARSIYMGALGPFLRKSDGVITPIYSAAIAVYVLLAIGILCFVIPRANGNYLHAFLWGALFGAITYGIYDFTNYALLANWPFKITFIDMGWGMIVCGLASLFATFIQNRL